MTPNPVAVATTAGCSRTTVESYTDYVWDEPVGQATPVRRVNHEYHLLGDAFQCNIKVFNVPDMEATVQEGKTYRVTIEEVE
jgi:hypothetical protein